MTTEARDADGALVLTYADMPRDYGYDDPPFRWLSFDAVPIPPKNATELPTASGDRLVERGRKRWRYRDGRLIFFCIYRTNWKTAAFPWEAAWSAPDGR